MRACRQPGASVEPGGAETLSRPLAAPHSLRGHGNCRRGLGTSPQSLASARRRSIQPLPPQKDVAAVLHELGLVIERHIKKRAVGTFTLPGLLRITRARKPARKARTMISPRTGEEIQVAAKPASTAVKLRPLAGLKRMVE